MYRRTREICKFRSSIQTFAEVISGVAGYRISRKIQGNTGLPSLRGILVTKFQCCSRTDAYSRTGLARDSGSSCSRSKFRSFRCLAEVFSVDRSEALQHRSNLELSVYARSTRETERDAFYFAIRNLFLRCVSLIRLLPVSDRLRTQLSK